jgi:hypothetical protein
MGSSEEIGFGDSLPELESAGTITANNKIMTFPSLDVFNFSSSLYLQLD